MSAPPVVYRSSDAGAPVLTGSAGSLINLLSTVLVNGYGGTAFATGTITSNGTAPSDGDTVTIGSTTYTFKTTLVAGNNNQVLIGASASAALTNLAETLGLTGTSGTTYNAVQTANTQVQPTSVTSTVITLQAMVAGTAGNSLALAKSATTLTVSGADLTGGVGTPSGGAGWTLSFTGTNGAVYRQLAGNQFYLLINDNGPGAGTFKEARVFPSVTCTAYSATAASSTGLFPTSAQQSTGVFIRKSSTLDNTTPHVWTVVADDRTMYLFVQTGDTAGYYLTFAFGDFYSLLSGDGYRTMVIGRETENSGTASYENLDKLATQTLSSLTGHFFAAAYTQTGGSINFTKHADFNEMGTTVMSSASNIPYPNPTDGGVYVARLIISDPSTAPTISRRGWLRGLWCFLHISSSVIDGDVFTATSGDLSGRSFIIVKASGNGGCYLIETSNTWDTSS